MSDFINECKIRHIHCVILSDLYIWLSVSCSKDTISRAWKTSAACRSASTSSTTGSYRWHESVRWVRQKEKPWVMSLMSDETINREMFMKVYADFARHGLFPHSLPCFLISLFDLVTVRLLQEIPNCRSLGTLCVYRCLMVRLVIAWSFYIVATTEKVCISVQQLLYNSGNHYGRFIYI